MKILLDTHVLIWLVNSDNRLSSGSLISQIDEAGFRNELYLSVISIWEVATLISKGRITVSDTPIKWINMAIELLEAKIIDINTEIICDSVNLSDNFNNDPADRLIVATARYLGATLMTADKDILSYAEKGHLKVVSV